MLAVLKLRIVFIFVLIAGGFVSMMLNFSPSVSITMWILALILGAGYLLFGTVNGALFMLNRGQVDEAEKLLAQTYKPEWLMKSHKAYYYFTKGLLALHKVNEMGGDDKLALKVGEEHLLKSLEIGLSRKQERAMAYLNLAAVALRNKDKAKTEAYYQSAKENEGTDLRMQKSLEDLAAAIARM
jgi:hypothetical protein